MRNAILYTFAAIGALSTGFSAAVVAVLALAHAAGERADAEYEQRRMDSAEFWAIVKGDASLDSGVRESA